MLNMDTLILPYLIFSEYQQRKETEKNVVCHQILLHIYFKMLYTLSTVQFTLFFNKHHLIRNLEEYPSPTIGGRENK